MAQERNCFPVTVCTRFTSVKRTAPTLKHRSRSVSLHYNFNVVDWVTTLPKAGLAEGIGGLLLFNDLQDASDIFAGEEVLDGRSNNL